MQTIAETTPTRKPLAYFAQLEGLSGILTKPGSDVLFVEFDTYAVTPITAANEAQVLVLRNVEEWMAEYYADLRSRLLARKAA